MCVRWLATVRSPRNSAAATSRFVRPSATSAATRRSAGVSPSSRVRPPIRPSSARARSTQRGRAELLEAVERRLDRLPRRRASAARAGATTPRASSARARPNGSPTASCSLDRLLEQALGAPRRRRARRRRARGSASRRRAPTRGRAASRPPPSASSERARRRRRGRARAAPRRSRRVHQRTLGSPQPSSAACSSASSSQSTRRRSVPAPERDEPEDREVLRRVEPDCSSASTSARSECSRASSS